MAMTSFKAYAMRATASLLSIVSKLGVVIMDQADFGSGESDGLGGIRR